MKISLQIETAAAEEKLRRLEVEGIPKALRKSLAKGAQPLRAAIRAQTPVGPTGNLQHAVRYKAMRKRYGLGYIIGPFGKGSSHRHLVVQGHEITREKGGPSFGRTRANPFVERGRQAAWGSAVTAATEALQAAVDAEMA